MSGDENNSNNTIEFNSMKAVLMRLDKITNYVNFHRSKSNYKTMHGYMIDYFKEIVADLTPAERESAWKQLTEVRKFLNLNSDLPPNPKVPVMLDEIDINLRLLAKAHGYLTTTKASMHSKLIS